MRKYLFQKIYSNSVRTVRFCAILHLSHPPTPSSVREKLHQPGAANKTKFLRSPGPSPPGWAAHRHCLSCPQLLLQRPRSGQVWPIVVDRSKIEITVFLTPCLHTPSITHHCQILNSLGWQMLSNLTPTHLGCLIFSHPSPCTPCSNHKESVSGL